MTALIARASVAALLSLACMLPAWSADAATEAGIDKKPAFARINVIQVNYVKRSGQHASAVQGLDYNQTPAGAFVQHKS